MEKPTVLWHYTAHPHLSKILIDGFLKVSNAEKLLKHKHPSLWFSSNPIWEPTATKDAGDEYGNRVPMTKEEQYNDFGLARIGINYFPELITWAKYRYLSMLPEMQLDMMEKIGREKGGNPKQWYTTFKSVSKDKWICVEIWDCDKWVKYENQNLKINKSERKN